MPKRNSVRATCPLLYLVFLKPGDTKSIIGSGALARFDCTAGR